MRRLLGVKEAAQDAATSALDAVADAFGGLYSKVSWDRRAELLPSALSAIDSLRQNQATKGKERKLLIPVASFLAKQGNQGGAQRLLQFELEYVDKEEPDWTLNNLARALWTAGLFTEAEKFCARLYSLYRVAPHANATKFAQICMLRAEVLADMGRLDEAEKCGREALEWMEYELGEENKGPAMFRRALAQVLKSVANSKKLRACCSVPMQLICGGQIRAMQSGT